MPSVHEYTGLSWRRFLHKWVNTKMLCRVLSRRSYRKLETFYEPNTWQMMTSGKLVRPSYSTCQSPGNVIPELTDITHAVKVKANLASPEQYY